MQTYADIRTDFLLKMNQTTTAAFYTETNIKAWFDMAHAWASAKYKWPMTEGRYSTTAASATTDENGYTVLEYPEGFRSDSIRMLTVAGKHFLKKNFYKWQEFVENNSSDTSVIFSDFARRIYFNPNAAGFSGTVTMYGQYNVAAIGYDTQASGIGDPSATTIFTGAEEDGNEAIVNKMMSYALTREKTPTSFYRGKYISASMANTQIATEMLDGIWARIQEEQYAYQDTNNEGMWKRFDVTRGGFKEDVFRRDQWGL